MLNSCYCKFAPQSCGFFYLSFLFTITFFYLALALDCFSLFWSAECQGAVESLEPPFQTLEEVQSSSQGKNSIVNFLEEYWFPITVVVCYLGFVAFVTFTTYRSGGGGPDSLDITSRFASPPPNYPENPLHLLPDYYELRLASCKYPPELINSLDKVSIDQYESISQVISNLGYASSSFISSSYNLVLDLPLRLDEWVWCCFVRNDIAEDLKPLSLFFSIPFLNGLRDNNCLKLVFEFLGFQECAHLKFFESFSGYTHIGDFDQLNKVAQNFDRCFFDPINTDTGLIHFWLNSHGFAWSTYCGDFFDAKVTSILDLEEVASTFGGVPILAYLKESFFWIFNYHLLAFLYKSGAWPDNFAEVIQNTDLSRLLFPLCWNTIVVLMNQPGYQNALSQMHVYLSRYGENDGYVRRFPDLAPMEVFESIFGNDGLILKRFGKRYSPSETYYLGRRQRVVGRHPFFWSDIIANRQWLFQNVSHESPSRLFFWPY